MINKKYPKIAALLVAVSMIVVLFAGYSAAQPAQSTPAPASDKVYTFKLAHHLPADHAVNGYALDFKKLVEAKSNGKIQIQVFEAGQLGGLKDNTDAIRYGTLDFAMIDLGTVASFYPKSSIVSLPFLFRDLKHVEAFFESPKMQEMTKDIAAKTNVRFLGYSHSGMRNIVSEKPINGPDDMKGMKIRAPDIPVYVDTLKALGANPTPIPSGEVYTALQTGVVEGMECPPDTLFSLKMQEVTKYIAITNHIYTDINLAMSEKLYVSLPDNLKKVIDDAAKEATANHRKLAQVLYDEFSKKLTDAGLIQTTPDQKAFAAKVAPVWKKYTDKVADGKDLIDYISNLK